MYLLPDSTTVPVFAFRNFLRPARQEVITLNIHRLRKGGAEESLIVPLTEIRPSRVISLPGSLESLPIRVHFASIFNSLRKREREREKKSRRKGKEKESDRIDFSPPAPLSLPVRTRNSTRDHPEDIVPAAEIHRDTDLNIHTWV